MRKLSKREKYQFNIGKKIEMEHTRYPKIAEKIAMDHLDEFKGKPYYTELVKMEKKLSKISKRKIKRR